MMMVVVVSDAEMSIVPMGGVEMENDYHCTELGLVMVVEDQ